MSVPRSRRVVVVGTLHLVLMFVFDLSEFSRASMTVTVGAPRWPILQPGVASMGMMRGLDLD